MDQNIADLLTDAFAEPNFEQLHFDDDTPIAHSVNAPQNMAEMEDDDNNSDRRSSESNSEEDLDGEIGDDDAKIPQNATYIDDESDSEEDLDGEIGDDDTKIPQNATYIDDDKNNNTESSGSESDFDLEYTNREEETKNSSENNRNFSSDEQSVKEGSTLDKNDTDEYNTPTQNQPLSLHDEDRKEDEFEVRTDVHHDHETTSTHEETTSHLQSYQMVDRPESSASEEDTMEPESTVENTPDDNELICLSAVQSTLQDWPVALVDVQSGGELKEFTEEDNEREEEGLAEYPSDLSQSDSGDSSEDQPSHMDTNLDKGLGLSDEVKNLEEQILSYQAVTSGEDHKVESVDHADMPPYVKNEDLYEEITSGKSDDILFQTKQGSFTDDDYNCEISNAGENSDFGISENFQSSSSDSYKNEQPDYDSDISSDGEYCKIQDEKPIHTSLHKQEHVEFSTDCYSIEHKEGDHQNLEISDVGSSSILLASGQEGSPESSCKSEAKAEHSSEHSEVSDMGENITLVLPGTFWSVIDEDNLKFDEYDWDINGEEVLCDEEYNFQEELENEEEGPERDWEKEKERIEAFNRYYDIAEGEENKDRSHMVTFCLEPKYSQYEEESDSSEEDPITQSCIIKLHSPESSSVQQDQSNKDDSQQASDTEENINEDNMKLDECDYNISEEEFYKMNSSRVICDDEDDFLEKLKFEIEQDLKKEQARTEGLLSDKEQHEVTDRTQKGLYLHQDSQNEEDNESSEQESNTEDDSSSALKIKDQSDSDEPQERRLYTGKHKVLTKGFQRADQQLKEPHKRNKCVFLLRSVFALGLGTVVGLLSYCWATDNMDLLNSHVSWIFNMIQNRK